MVNKHLHIEDLKETRYKAHNGGVCSCGCVVCVVGIRGNHMFIRRTGVRQWQEAVWGSVGTMYLCVY